MAKLCFLADAHSIHTRKWVNYFAKENYDIHIISMRATDYAYPANVQVHILQTGFTSKASYFLLIGKTRKLVKEINPDILHSHYATSYGLYGRMCNTHPFVISVWGSDVYEFPKKSPLHKLLLQYILKGADQICSTSRDMAEETKKYENRNILITPFGVDLQKFQNNTPILTNSYITIGIAKGLEEIYGINYLIEGVAELIKGYGATKEIRLLIVGDGSKREALENLAREQGISSKVIFTGAVDNELVPAYINQMDIICMPSLSESFGVAAVEACACGRPIVTTKVGGLKEVVCDGINGYVIKEGDSRDITEKLQYMIEHPEKMKQFSKQAREFVEKTYDWQRNAEIMKKMYESLLNGNN